VVFVSLIASSIYSSAQPLRIGYGNFPPYNFRNASNQPVGFQIEILNQAARRSGIALDWTYSPGVGMACLSSNACDLWAQASTRITPEQGIALSKPWWGLHKSFLVTRPADFRKPSDFRSRTLASLSSSSILREIGKESPAASIATFPSRAIALQALCRGQVDGYFDSTAELIQLSLSRPPDCQTSSLHLIPARTTTPFGLAARSMHESSMQRLRSEIDAMSIDGTLMEIASHYMLFADLESYVSYSQTQNLLRRNTLIYIATGLCIISLLAAYFVYRLKLSNLRLAEALDRAEASNRSKREFLTMIATSSAPP